MAKWRQTVEAILAEMGLSTAVAKEVGKEVHNFRKFYADRYELDLTWPVMQDSSSNHVENMARTYFEDGLPTKGIHPGQSRWSADLSAAQREQEEYSIPKHRILELLQKLIAHKNWNLTRNSNIVTPREETSSPISSGSDQAYTVRPTRGRGQKRGRSGLRSSDTRTDEGSTEYSLIAPIAPIAKMEYDFETLDQTNRYTYGGLPEVVDLETYGDEDALTSELKGNSNLTRDDRQAATEVITGGISADVENHQALLSGPADLSPASEQSLETTNDTAQQHFPSQDDTSGVQQRFEDSSLGQTGQTTMVGPYQRQSKVIVLKWKQRKRQATEDGIPRLGSAEDSSRLVTASQNDSIDEGTKRRRLGDMNSTPTLPQPVVITDTKNSDGDNPSHIFELPAVEMHQSARLHATISNFSDGGEDSLNTKQRSSRSGSKTPTVSNRVPEQEQADQGSADSEGALQSSFWLLDPRGPGGTLRTWPGNKPFSQTIHHVFDKTTELLETDRYTGIQFLFTLNNQPGEMIFQVGRGALVEFQSMIENAPKGLKKMMMKASEKKVTEVDVTLRPVGLTEVGSFVSAVVAQVEDQDLDGIDALFR